VSEIHLDQPILLPAENLNDIVVIPSSFGNPVDNILDQKWSSGGQFLFDCHDWGIVASSIIGKVQVTATITKYEGRFLKVNGPTDIALEIGAIMRRVGNPATSEAKAAYYDQY